MDKTACPHCGELNYTTARLCWACGKPTAPAAPSPAPEPSPPPAPPIAPPPPVDPSKQKPAEIEAMQLRDRDFVTPPVDVDVRPSSLGEWLSWVWQAVLGSGQAFRSALDDYDRRRGRRTGALSSFGCLVIGVVLLVLALVFYWGAAGALHAMG